MSSHAANRPLLLPHVDLHDVQRVAVPGGCRGRGRRILFIRLEEVGDRGRDRALPLTTWRPRPASTSVAVHGQYKILTYNML